MKIRSWGPIQMILVLLVLANGVYGAEANLPIRITKFETSPPDAAGGIDGHVGFFVLSEKKIKAIRFFVTPFGTRGEAVGDKFAADLDRTLDVIFPDPLYSKQMDVSFDRIWYSYKITCMRLVGIEIQYANGKFSRKNKEQAIKQFYAKNALKACVR